jgi:hypothetical protein
MNRLRRKQSLILSLEQSGDSIPIKGMLLIQSFSAITGRNTPAVTGLIAATDQRTAKEHTGIFRNVTVQGRIPHRRANVVMDPRI